MYIIIGQYSIKTTICQHTDLAGARSMARIIACLWQRSVESSGGL
jgi:hypothetical protein